MSSGRTVPAWYGNQVEVSYIMAQNPYTNIINLPTPNVSYSGRTAPLTSKVAFYIFIQQI